MSKPPVPKPSIRSRRALKRIMAPAVRPGPGPFLDRTGMLGPKRLFGWTFRSKAALARNGFGGEAVPTS